MDRVTLHVLEHSKYEYKVYSYLERGSDEMQYGSPKINLPVGSLMRSKYREYPEYHTSGDNLDFVSSESLAETFDMYLTCFKVIENNHVYENLIYGEPQLGKRGLYHNLSTVENVRSNFKVLDVITYCDGHNDLLEVADILGLPMLEIIPMVKELVKQKILRIKLVIQ